MTYRFHTQDGTFVDSPDGFVIPWNADANRPADMDSAVATAWRNAGSPAPEPYIAPPAPPVMQVTRTQGKIALLRAGLLEGVKVAASQDPELQIWFDDEPTWHRYNKYVMAMAEKMRLSEIQIDALFAEAATIQ